MGVLRIKNELITTGNIAWKYYEITYWNERHVFSCV